MAIRARSFSWQTDLGMDGDSKQVRARYRRQPEDGQAQELLLPRDQLLALLDRKLILRDLLGLIQEASRSPVSNVNAVYLWNFTTGMYDLADPQKLVEATHLKDGLLDLVLAWRPPTDPEMPSGEAAAVLELRAELQAVKALVREMLKAPAYQNAQPDLQAQVVKNFGQQFADEAASPTQVVPIGRREGREDLDFAFLYSNPLVARNAQGGVSSLNEPVNFSGECNDIIKVIEEKKKKFSVEIEVASENEFLKVLRKKPKILHIMCHGSVETKKSSSIYFLEFEGENGEQFQLTQDILKKDLERFGMPLDFVQLAFVNSCHSEVGYRNDRKWARYS